MAMISFAQNAEDVLLSRAFAGVERGFYIDVGANDPVHQSVTKHFYDLGWHGINIEPGPDAFRRLSDGRPRDANLNVGVSDREGKLTFYEATGASGWSTFSAAQAANLRRDGLDVVERTVRVTTLASVCEQHFPETIDFLKVDAESHEREVLEGADWRRWRPRVVLVEANGVADWEPLLLSADYHFACFDGINRFYVRDEDRDLLPPLSAPPSVADDFIPYKYLSQIEDLRARLAGFEGLGPTALEVARRSQRLANRFPRLARAAKRWALRAG